MTISPKLIPPVPLGVDKTADPVDILYDRSLCKPTITWRCFGADGKIILDKDRKSTPIYPNNLKLKLNRKKNNIAFQQNPNRDTLIYLSLIHI